MKKHLNIYGVFCIMFALVFVVRCVVESIFVLGKTEAGGFREQKVTCHDYTEKLRGHVIKGGIVNAEKHGDGWRVLVRYFDTSNPDQITRATAECVLDKDFELVVLRRFNQPAQD